MEEFEIKACPCCGGMAEVKEIEKFTCQGFIVKCKKCHVGTNPVYVAGYLVFKGRKNVTVTRDMAIREVVRVWNRREVLN